MTDDEKDKYKVLAREYNNSTLMKQRHLKNNYDVQKNSNDFWNTQKYLTKMFECISNNEAKIYPKGFAGGMKQFSDKFHKILCFDEHPNDYKKILLKFLTFLKDGIINHTDLLKATLDLPYLFTIESEIGTNMMKTKNSLE